MKTNERTVHFYDLNMKSFSRADGVKNPGCAPLPLVLETIFNRYQLVGTELVNRDTLTVDVSDASFDPNTGILCLLINRADGERSDVTFKDFGSKSRRKGNKTKSEGIESSCHVVIKPTSDDRTGIMLMTMGAGVSSDAVERVLSIALDVIKNDPAAQTIFQFEHPSGEQVGGKAKTYKVRYGFDCLGLKGTLLDEALAKGTFESMQLVAHKFDKFDSGGNLQIEEYSVGVRALVPETVTGAAIKNAFRSYMKNMAGHNYDQLRIRYKKPDGDSSVASLDANNLDAAFTKKEKIKLDIGLDEQQLKMSPDIIGKMLALI